jgi:(2R)-3-sulfolactate dehydrogenase (NADP+)
MKNVTISLAEARRICTEVLKSSGASDHNARLTAEALVRAEADGQRGHGLSRLPSYAAQVKTGKVDGRAVPRLREVKAGLVRVDAGFGFAYPALQVALVELKKRVASLGLAAAAIYHSHHFGVAGHPCEELARQGYVAFIYGNTPKAIAPHGSHQKLLGTNPIAFAAPCHDDPVVIDFAVSIAARGKIMAAKQAGEQIPPGWALSSSGEPTTNPEEALAGSMLPIGGAKGAALALMVEIMSACLVGTALGAEASSLFEGAGEAPNLGQVILAIDADALSSGQFVGRMESLVALYDSLEGARLPGTRRVIKRELADQHGLEMPAKLMAEINKLLDR